MSDKNDNPNQQNNQQNNQQSSLDPSCRVFVGGISWKADETSLRQCMSTYGTVVECKIIMDKQTGKSKGYGFVTFSSPIEAQKVKNAQNINFMGKMMNVGDAVRKNDSQNQQQVGGTNKQNFSSNQYPMAPPIFQYYPNQPYNQTYDSQQYYSQYYSPQTAYYQQFTQQYYPNNFDNNHFPSASFQSWPVYPQMTGTGQQGIPQNSSPQNPPQQNQIVHQQTQNQNYQN